MLNSSYFCPSQNRSLFSAARKCSPLLRTAVIRLKNWIIARIFYYCHNK